MKKFYFLGLFVCLLLLPWGVWAQTRTITGKVTSASNGETLPGVSILLKGTTNGTVSDFEGNFRLNVPVKGGTLVFSFVGYQTQEVPLTEKNVYNVSLHENVTKLNEVVVSALGFKQQKDQMGTAVSVVNPQEITSSGEVNLINSLSAKASNVKISVTNGDPGAGSNIRIRGANTITGSNQPLIIVDGVPVDNSTTYGGGNNITGGRTGGTSQESRLNDINPDDIQSVQVLKGAAAASLWGSRAANGVIVITTKRGRAGKLHMGYKFTTSFDQVSQRIPMQHTWGQGRGGKYSPTKSESWGDYIPDRAGGDDVFDKSGKHFVAEDGTIYYPIKTKNSKATFVDSNWDAVFHTGVTTQHNLNLSGGTDKLNFYFSLGRLDQNGIIRESYYNRTNLRLNTNFHIVKWLSGSIKAAYNHDNSNRIQQSSNTAGLMLGLLRNPPDFDIRDYIGTYVDNSGAEFPLRHRSYRNYIGSSQHPHYNNPMWTIYQQLATTKVDRIIFVPEINIIPLEWLRFTLRGGVDTYGDHRLYFFPIGSAGSRNNGTMGQDVIWNMETNFDAIAMGNFHLGKNISLQATLGFNVNDRRRKSNYAELNGFLVNARKHTTDLNTAAENSTISNYQRQILSNRGYLILSFHLFNQLFVTLSGTGEAASTIKGNYYYPSVEAAWQASKILNLDPAKMSFLKIRASWGKVGTQPGAYHFQNLAESGFTYSSYSDPLDIELFGGGFRLDNNKGTPDLKPEIKTEWEVGADMRFLNNNLTLSMTYYQNRINDILINVGLTTSSGFDTQYDNAASMKNHGFEATLDYTIFHKKNWDIGIYSNFGLNRNEVLSLKGTNTINLSPGASVSSRAIVGYPLGELYGTSAQVDANGKYVLNSNGFPILTPSPVPLGDPNPKWRGGFGFRAKWKGISLDVLFDHSQGGVFSPRTLWVLRRFGTTQETANRFTTSQDLVDYAGKVIPAGTTVRGNVADFGGGPVLLDESWYRTGIGGGFGDNQAYNFSIKDATFTKLKQLTLSYTLNNKRFQQKSHLNSLVFAVTGRDLFLWSHIEGIDPEISQTGVGNAIGLDYFTNPTTRSVLFSIAVNY